MSHYIYANGPLLDNPQSYQYSEYIGEPFIQSWYQSRKAVLDGLPCAAMAMLEPCVDMYTKGRLTQSCLKMRQGDLFDESENAWVLLLVRKFEFSKRLFVQYQAQAPHRPIKESGYHDMWLYLLLAESLCHLCLSKLDIRLLNCLLKLCDTLCAEIHRLDQTQKAQLAWILQQELSLMDHLKLRLHNR